MATLTEQLLDELKEWCGDIRGRKTEAAKAAGTSLQAIVDWFAKRRQHSNLRSTVGRAGVIPRMGIEDVLMGLRALIAYFVVQAIVRLPESGPTGASMRGIWPPRNTLLPSNSVRWSMGVGLSQSCSFITPERP